MSVVRTNLYAASDTIARKGRSVQSEKCGTPFKARELNHKLPKTKKSNNP